MAEEEGFEPPVTFATTVFKTAAFGRSATPPCGALYTRSLVSTKWIVYGRASGRLVPSAERWPRG